MRVYDHGVASRGRKPKMVGSARFPKVSEIAKKCLGGIDPLALQLLTAGSPTPKSAAAAAVPPRASTMSSTELSMTDTNSRIVKMSSVHNGGIDFGKKSFLNNRMETKEQIGDRLRVWLLAKFMRAAKLAKLVDIEANEWSAISSGDRMITVEQADMLCHQFQLTLDWIFRNDVRNIDEDILEKIKKVRDMERAGIPVPKPPIERVRKPSKVAKPPRRKTAQ